MSDHIRDKDNPLIRSALIENFRCFSEANISDLAQFNIIVGDSGAGKTALLEAIFLALGSSPELTLRYRGHRGQPNQFSGPIQTIRMAVWEYLFFNGRSNRPIRVNLEGSGPEGRSVVVSVGGKQGFYSFSDFQVEADSGHNQDVVFEWRNSSNVVRQTVAKVSPNGITYDDPEERDGDFYYFHSGNQGAAIENATRFSQLSKSGSAHRFIDLLGGEFDWLGEVKIEVDGGVPVLYVFDKISNASVPLSGMSGGINKFVMIALAMLREENSIFLIDEIENGVYYQRYGSYWRIITKIAQEQGHQVFATTHSSEFLASIADQIPMISDELSLMRLSRERDGVNVEQFPGDQLHAALEFGEEVR